MIIGVKLEGNVLWVRPYGPRLDAAVTPAFKSAVSSALVKRPRIVVINAATLTFVDSTGLGAIVGVMKQMDTNGVLAIVAPSINFQRLLTMTGLDRVFKIYPDLAAAEADLLKDS